MHWAAAVEAAVGCGEAVAESEVAAGTRATEVAATAATVQTAAGHRVGT